VFVINVGLFKLSGVARLTKLKRCFNKVMYMLQYFCASHAVEPQEKQKVVLDGSKLRLIAKLCIFKRV
jgi:hypothetical protein